MATAGGDKAAVLPPATVAQVAKEDQLNTISLTPEAARRLGIAIAPVEERSLDRYRLYGGETTLPVGASLTISAPLAGTIQAPVGGAALVPGVTVDEQQPVFALLPMLSPERAVLTPNERIGLAQTRATIAQSQIDASAQVEQAVVQVGAARIALDRAERLLREQAGSARAVDDAKAQYELATKSLEAAKTRKQLVDNIKLDEDPGKVVPIVIGAPHAGLLRAVHVAPGETVAAGAPLFEVMSCSPIWIRVPVYVGELGEIDEAGSARISSLADKTGASAQAAKRVGAPPTAVALAATVDLYYQLANTDGALRPGQRLSARLPLRNRRPEQRVLPWSAVMHDIQGGTWVYERVADNTFVRRRVQVQAVVDDLAVIEGGPPVGAQLVTAGAVELFGTEFGFAK